MKLRLLLVPLTAGALLVPIGVASASGAYQIHEWTVAASAAGGAPPQTLRLADMPSGWTQTAHSPGRNACRFVSPASGRRIIEFAGSGEDSLTSAVMSFSTIAGARRAMATNLARGRTCRMTTSGNARLTQMSFPRIGAQSFGLKLFATLDGNERSIGGMVLLRSGRRVAYLGYVSLFPDIAQFQTLARAALRRLG